MMADNPAMHFVRREHCIGNSVALFCCCNHTQQSIRSHLRHSLLKYLFAGFIGMSATKSSCSNTASRSIRQWHARVPNCIPQTNLMHMHHTQARLRSSWCKSARHRQAAHMRNPAQRIIQGWAWQRRLRTGMFIRGGLYSAQNAIMISKGSQDTAFRKHRDLVLTWFKIENASLAYTVTRHGSESAISATWKSQ